MLTFHALAWMKLLFFLHKGDTEIGGFGISDKTDPLYIIDFRTVTQETSAVYVEFDDTAVADFYEDCVDEGMSPNRFSRIWCHTHPGESPDPSGTDEQTFFRVFGKCDWSVMFIIGRTQKTYARLQFSAGPGGSIMLPVKIDWTQWPQHLDENNMPGLVKWMSSWNSEFSQNIKPCSHGGYGSYSDYSGYRSWHEVYEAGKTESDFKHRNRWARKQKNRSKVVTAGDVLDAIEAEKAAETGGIRDDEKLRDIGLAHLDLFGNQGEEKKDVDPDPAAADLEDRDELAAELKELFDYGDSNGFNDRIDDAVDENVITPEEGALLWDQFVDNFYSLPKDLTDDSETFEDIFGNNGIPADDDELFDGGGTGFVGEPAGAADKEPAVEKTGHKGRKKQIRRVKASDTDPFVAAGDHAEDTGDFQTWAGGD